jgi:hypothetical protein
MFRVPKDNLTSYVKHSKAFFFGGPFVVERPPPIGKISFIK